MFSSREVFREKWNEWLISNNELIDIEKARLTEIGYTKSVTAKMFISARYYFKNKEHKPEQDTSKEKETTKTRAYIKISKELLKEIDIYIGENSNRDVKPSTSYELFVELNQDLIDRETNRSCGVQRHSAKFLNKPSYTTYFPTSLGEREDCP